MSDNKYTAGLYLRLSKDDERAGESVSIENQRLLLTNYAQEKGWDIQRRRLVRHHHAASGVTAYDTRRGGQTD